MLLNDRQIKELVRTHNLIEDFDKDRLNSFGYDLTLSKDFMIPKPNYLKVQVVDPMNIGEIEFEEFSQDFAIIPPSAFLLGRSIEKVNMPSFLTGMCIGRSTYARCGIIANVTPLEAGWSGTVTIEMSNSNQLPAKVHANKGIIQVLFFEGQVPERTYLDKGGKYQNQTGITLAKGL